MNEITAHVRVRNEEKFVKAAIESILPLVSKVIVCDTDSTDKTLDEIAAIKSNKISLVHKPLSDGKGLCEYRNEMIEATTTKWFWLVDGDEIYETRGIQKIPGLLQILPGDFHRVLLYRRHFYKSYDLITGWDVIGRIYRTSAIRWKMDPPDTNHIGNETPWLRDNPSGNVDEYSILFPRSIFFYHMHFLERSSMEKEMAFRRWRKPPFPLFLCLNKPGNLPLYQKFPFHIVLKDWILGTVVGLIPGLKRKWWQREKKIPFIW